MSPLQAEIDPVSIVLVPGPLPKGALAIVQMRPRGLQRIFIVVSEARVNDALFLRALGVTRTYTRHHPDDKGHIDLAMLPDGRLETTSDARGSEVGSHVPVAQHSSGEEELTMEVFARANATAAANFPGFGPARVVDWIGAPQ